MLVSGCHPIKGQGHDHWLKVCLKPVAHCHLLQWNKYPLLVLLLSISSDELI